MQIRMVDGVIHYKPIDTMTGPPKAWSKSTIKNCEWCGVALNENNWHRLYCLCTSCDVCPEGQRIMTIMCWDCFDFYTSI